MAESIDRLINFDKYLPHNFVMTNVSLFFPSEISWPDFLLFLHSLCDRLGYDLEYEEISDESCAIFASSSERSVPMYNIFPNDRGAEPSLDVYLEKEGNLACMVTDYLAAQITRIYQAKYQAQGQDYEAQFGQCL